MLVKYRNKEATNVSRRRLDQRAWLSMATKSKSYKCDKLENRGAAIKII